MVWTVPVVSDQPCSVIVGGGGVKTLHFCVGTAYNIPSMEDTGIPSWNMSDSGIQNRLLFEGLEFGTCKFTWNGS